MDVIHCGVIIVYWEIRYNFMVISWGFHGFDRDFVAIHWDFVDHLVFHSHGYGMAHHLGRSHCFCRQKVRGADALGLPNARASVLSLGLLFRHWG